MADNYPYDPKIFESQIISAANIAVTKKSFNACGWIKPWLENRHNGEEHWGLEMENSEEAMTRTLKGYISIDILIARMLKFLTAALGGGGE